MYPYTSQAWHLRYGIKLSKETPGPSICSCHCAGNPVRGGTPWPRDFGSPREVHLLCPPRKKKKKQRKNNSSHSEESRIDSHHQVVGCHSDGGGNRRMQVRRRRQSEPNQPPPVNPPKQPLGGRPETDITSGSRSTIPSQRAHPALLFP